VAADGEPRKLSSHPCMMLAWRLAHQTAAGRARRSGMPAFTKPRASRRASPAPGCAANAATLGNHTINTTGSHPCSARAPRLIVPSLCDD